jgi:hypothetical protein
VHLLSSFHPLVARDARPRRSPRDRPDAGTGRSSSPGACGLPASMASAPFHHRVPVSRLAPSLSPRASRSSARRRLDVIHAHQARGNAILGLLACLGGPPPSWSSSRAGCAAARRQCR